MSASLWLRHNLRKETYPARIPMLSVRRVSLVVLFFLFSVLVLRAADNPFRDAPSSAKAVKNPLASQPAAIGAGKTVYARNCLSCHGRTVKGTGNVPSLIDGKLKGVSEGEIFWFVTKGDKPNGMPSWAFLPEEKRWQVVSYVQAVETGKVTASGGGAAPTASPSGAALKDPSPNAPFTDFRY